jgi:hypothetical protein
VQNFRPQANLLQKLELVRRQEWSEYGSSMQVPLLMTEAGVCALLSWNGSLRTIASVPLVSVTRPAPETELAVAIEAARERLLPEVLSRVASAAGVDLPADDADEEEDEEADDGEEEDGEEQEEH